MLVGSDSGLVDGPVGRLLANIEDHDGTVVTTGGDQSGAGRVEVNAHDTRVGGEGVLGPGGVLDGEAADETAGLLQEFVATVGNGEHVLVTGVPAHGGNVLSLGLLSGESPEGEDGTERFGVGVVSVVQVVLVIVEDVVLSVLDDHALHDLEASLHGGGVDGLLVLDLDDLSGLLVLGLALGGLFSLHAESIFVELHESIEDHPLGGLLGEDGGLGMISLDTTLTVDNNRGLGGSLLVVEHVSERFLLLIKSIVYKTV